MITDYSGRQFKKLRVSLTHQCNYACIYCVDSNPDTQTGATSLSGNGKKLLSSSELIEIIGKLHATLNLNAVRITGGEPLLQPRIISVLQAIRAMGISNIGMTTNGHLLGNKAKSLYNAGLRSVNISMDAVTPAIFRQMALRNGLSNVIRAIDASIEAGLSVKLNTVVVSGKNHHEILPLLNFALQRRIVIRFLELMPMGPLHERMDEKFFSRTKILNMIETAYPIEPLPREDGSTSNYWSIGGKKAFGIIANESTPFCSDCNRLRLDSYGNIYGCLSSMIPISLTPHFNKYQITAALKLALSHKQSSHFIGNSHTMQSIGG